MMLLSNQEIESMYPQAWKSWNKRPEHTQGVTQFSFKDGFLFALSKTFGTRRQVNRNIVLTDRKEICFTYDDQEEVWKSTST